MMNTGQQITREHREKVLYSATPGRPRWRFLWLTVAAFVATGTITFISVPPALSPTFVLSSDAQANVAPHLIADIENTSVAMLTSPDTSEAVPAGRLTFGAGIEDALQALALPPTAERAGIHAAATGFESRRGSPQYEARLVRVRGVIERSLFDDGQASGLSDRLIMELAEIFGWDIDFVLDLHQGDSFTVIHEEKYWRGQKVADGDILAAEFVNRGRVFRAIGYRAPGAKIEYYTPEGLALRRAFLRTPVKFSRVSSLFSNSRYHPVLKMWRAHHGVDYDAPTGTPVRATASGRVMAVGWNGGYGNTVSIRHPGPYSTLYAHLKGYRAGLRAGQHVSQGEIIGYVGRTGLATGPHLHYELQVNGAHRDPLTFELPKTDRVAVAPTTRPLFLRHAAELIAQFEVSTDARLDRRLTDPFTN